MDDIIKTFCKLKGKNYGGRLENWVMRWTEVGNIDKPAQACGNLYDDPNSRFGPDGTWIYTSMIVELNEEERFLITSNSLYELGEKREESPRTDEDQKKLDDDLDKFGHALIT